MKEPRYTAKNIQAVLEEQERSLRWLTGKVNDAGVPVSKSLMWYIAGGKRTASLPIAQTVCDILKVPFFLLFESTDQNQKSRTENAA